MTPDSNAMNRSTLAYSFFDIVRFGNDLWFFNA